MSRSSTKVALAAGRYWTFDTETAGLMGSSLSYGLMGTHLPLMVLRPDLIVLGASGMGAAGSLLAASVAAKVLHLARIPVVLAR